ncbi:DUF1834 family protein [Desulfovibrio sp. OttesenSCG-928-G15]|nr:DUF1834 family protein [Desulfovibrio sp. OttesenSCG-928-G15]
MIAIIEQAIKQHIANAGLAYLRHVATYRADFDADLTRVIRSTPAIWVTFRGAGKAKELDTTREKWLVPVTFMVIAGARRIHNEEAARHGVTTKNGVEVGTYQMLADVAALLLQNDLRLDGVDYLCPGRISVLANGLVQNEKMSIIGQEWHTHYVQEVRKPDRVRAYGDMRGPDAPPLGPEGTSPGTSPGIPPETPGDATGGTSAPGNTPPDAKPGTPAPGEPYADGTTLPPLPEIPWLDRIGLDYWLQPRNPDQQEPDAQDLITLTGDSDNG